MEEKKYQVFISSTYTDLIEERKKIVDVILTAGCIPVGMENFIATDQEQLNVIKRIIDLCDYYVLIIGGRYGSIDPSTGKSYTELEYEYAIEKGIPVLAFAINDTVNLSDDKKEALDSNKARLALFREKALTNRLAGIWGNKDELAYKVFAAITNAKQEFERPGWVRGGKFNSQTLLDQIVSLTEENKKLKEENETLKKNENVALADNEFYKKKIKLHYEEDIFFFASGMVIDEKDVEITYEEIFKQVSLRFLAENPHKEFVNAINGIVPGYHTTTKAILEIRAQFLIFGLIDVKKVKQGKDSVEMISLTQKGLDEMKRLNAQ